MSTTDVVASFRTVLERLLRVHPVEKKELAWTNVLLYLLMSRTTYGGSRMAC